MNHDDIEQKLRALTGALQRPDPTPAWKTEMLARARREASVIPIHRKLPPRWLMLGWAAAWVAIVAMNLSTPHNPSPSAGVNSSGKPSPLDATPPRGELSAFFAFQQPQDLNLNLP